MSLGIIGRVAFAARQGRNQAFNSAGNVIAAVSMGFLGYLVSDRSIFFFVVLLAIPTSLVLLLVRPAEINHELARGANVSEKGAKVERVWSCGLPVPRRCGIGSVRHFLHLHARDN